ncbi:hypothetical protein DYB30_000624 [Aphanomyces astaci]|uniref:Uncharacterized protein n=1 Tax=Aphanomyces astaci TaxID=112090 RepID=A0A397CP43_APHAT|nr:hypothetical protein DYB30_000624 [Aphanomyces astaci]
MRSQRGPPLRSPRHSPTSGSNNDEPSSTVLDPALADPIRRQVQSCRKADFHEVLGGTSHTPSVLRRIPLSPRCDVDTAQAFRDAVREDIVLNGMRCTLGYEAQSPRTAVVPPFVLVDTVIVEEINFATDAATRYLSVRSPVPDVDVHSELRELF